MTKKLHDLSGKIDSIIVSIYETISYVSKDMDIHFFVIGATARDLIWQYVYGFEIKRATHDIDLAVMIESWDDYEHLKNGLVSTGRFKKQRNPQRFLYKSQIPIDIVPFGDKVSDQNSISWPPKHDTKMSTLGFDDALDSAITVRLRSQPPVDIKVATPAAIVALKLISWDERYPERSKDAIDIAFMLRNYQALGNYERIYEEHTDLIDTDNYDYDHAGAELLGRDIALLLNEKSREHIERLLDKEIAENNVRYRLVENMTTAEYKNLFDENLLLVEALSRGVKSQCS